eukprot:TRINITY_DN61645_c0_g1_i2.p1 TRINITY_DN61645_c0_g1~~TRINITY_DN61645_c0_g1_i2.p1  ORF type:complete len:350 (+),score=32.24 TRINITY_DN61645_c0_g1_i2:180-1229(+)
MCIRDRYQRRVRGGRRRKMRLVALLLTALATVSLAFRPNSNSRTHSHLNHPWPADIPKAWDWCAQGYCSKIKTQCGGTCVNNAAMTAIESRVWIHLHPPGATRPPAVPTFSLGNHTYCSGGRKSKPSLEDFVKAHGVYDEKDWPFEGTCHMCDSGMGNCSSTACALTRLPSTCPAAAKARAQASRDPCLCAHNAVNEGGQAIIHPLCETNLIERNFSTCSCSRMQSSAQPLFSPAQIAPALAGDLLLGRLRGNGSEPKDAAYARYLFHKGPSIGHVRPGSWSADREKPGGKCEAKAGHMITIVGYNMTASPPFWILRNSWSARFGDRGFMYVKMDCGCKSETGLCSDLN